MKGWGLLTTGFALQIAFIVRWWEESEVAPLGLRLSIGLGVLLSAVGLAQVAGRLAHTRNPLLGFTPAALTLLALLVAAEALLRAYQVPPGLVPTPTRVLATLYTVRDVLLQDAYQTVLKEALVGYLIGCSLGVLTAFLVSRYLFLERGFLPYATLFSSIPIVALAPVLVKMVGIDWPSKAAICAITVYFPVVVNTFRGLTEVSPISLDLMRSYAASEMQQYRWLRLPNALPFIFNALKLGTTLAMIGAIVGEFFGANGQGLGFRIQIEAGRFGFDIVWAAIIVASAAGIVWYGLVTWVERRLTGWHVSFRRG
ncbi:MAG: ABC transporter permease [Meiothermus sp.]|uniref:ABC transporter permease n=1 Tax=Meiothermus sp. TaxID=1955249 RepID=UPI0025E692EA|nr:ABC transporter permease [Meiothermus sp.]MCS7058726.1 ABC transporter permease [Meiothermus sp.]MCS7194575.1 ABC transporter permease [Meiothermus sp.]MDW8090769.1 ABC transporter permease [Meiothermus sp.]MDW8480807.1 ABC transporter permease [Meiothermus sp.]